MKRVLLFSLAILLVFSFCACESSDSYEENLGFWCNHSESDWIVDEEATKEADGWRHTECLECGEKIREEAIIWVCPHTETRWITDVEATLENEGSKHQECAVCGETIQTETIPELALSQAEIEQKLKKSMVKVVCYDYDGKTQLSQGSGFFINSDGTFITNAHVVENCYYIKIKNYLGSEYEVDRMYVYNYTTSDYAICKTAFFLNSDPVEFAESAEIGDTVYALGYPNDAFLLNISSGEITALSANDGASEYYVSSARIAPGSSGGILTNDKGQVLGITTGEFSGGEYATLKYSEFKIDAERTHVGIKEPLEYFHSVEEVDLYSFNVDDYFDIYVNDVPLSDTSVSYTVMLSLKDAYANKKILMDSMSVSITVKIDTEFNYFQDTGYTTLRGYKSTTDWMYFSFYNESSLVSGRVEARTASTFIPSSTVYYGMQITYDVDFSSALGSILIFD